MRTALSTLLLLVALLPGAAQAQEYEAPMNAWDALAKMPPRTSYEMGVHMSFGTIGYWRNETEPWVGFGLRGGWGRVFSDDNRLGFGVGFNIEGPVPIFYSASLEPQLTWDRVRGGVQLGASVGPSFMLHSKLELSGPDIRLGVAPMASLRIGYSEAWSRMGRRFYAVLEPKVRWVRSTPDLEIEAIPDMGVALVVGSGRGR